MSTLLGRVIKPLLERCQMLLNCRLVVTSLLRGSLQLRGYVSLGAMVGNLLPVQPVGALLMVIGGGWIAWSARRRSGSELYRPAGAENLTRAVSGPHGDVWI